MTQPDRRFPSSTEQLKDENYKDILYAALQMFSQWDDKRQIRFINTKGPTRIPVTQLAKLCMITRHTVDAQLIKLADAGYIYLEDDKIFLPKVGQFYFMIPYQTLFFMKKVFSAHVIKVYTYLGRMWQYYIEESIENNEVVFTENVLIETIGMRPNEAINHRTVQAILVSLSNNGLIAYTKKISDRGNSLYVLTEMNTVVRNWPPSKTYTPM
jgi:predicted transcriptional regulator